MSDDKFETLDQLEMGDKVRIHFPGDDPAEAGDATIDNPLETTVEFISERELDHKEHHDVDGIVNVKKIYIEVPDEDDVHDEYVIETRSPIVGDKTVRPIETREYFEGRNGDGKYKVGALGFEDIEILD